MAATIARDVKPLCIVPLDERCASHVESYVRFTTDPDETLVRHPLDDIVTLWMPLLRTDLQRQWLSDFADCNLTCT